MKEEITLNQILTLEDPRQIKLMTLRYVDKLKWDEIGYEMHYSSRQIARIHQAALSKLKEEMES